MSILREILEWSQHLPAWQSDAIARLFEKQKLTPEDYNDLYALLKAEHGIPDSQGRTAKKLSKDQIPAPIQPNIKITLVAMKNLRHVNAIAEDQRLPFSETGLTVIYGDNGSGKSGYSRVLKRACRARDQREPIHANAKLPEDMTGNAEAGFEVSVNGNTSDVTWIDGATAPEALSSLAVFDSRCARAYLDDEDDFAYVPYGLDILNGLAAVCDQLKAMIEREVEQTTFDKVIFSELIGSTSVGKLVEGLSHGTKTEEVEALAALNPEEVARHEELGKTLKEGSPKEKTKQLRLCSSRMGKAAHTAMEKLAIVDDIAIGKFRGLAESHRTAQEAADLAMRKFREQGNFLPGTGGEAWNELFEAARKFSSEAYPEKKFPFVEDGAQCPLCQQPLGDGADRFRGFEMFVQQEAEKNARARKMELSDFIKIFDGQNLTFLDSELYAEIETLDKTLSQDVRDFESALVARHKDIKIAASALEWDRIENLPPNPSIRLQEIAAKMNHEADTLEKASDEKTRANMQSQFNEFEARIKLAKHKAKILDAIELLSKKNKLEECLSGVKTNAISLKVAELTEKIISKQLEEALNQEFKGLGAENLHVSLKSRTVKGKPQHKLKLNLPQTKHPHEILSEGEQRAIAISSFLAEVAIGSGTGGIIFDDPVSSLDHKRRELVARRLVKEGEKRQVIIFTHDIYFLCILMEEASNAGVSISTQSLIRRSDGYGVIEPNLPFEGMKTTKRIGFLKNMQTQVAKAHKDGNDVEHRKLTVDAYRQLRLAWERAVEEVLLRNVVLRFRKGIETQRLSGVQVEDGDFHKIDQCMSKCSNYFHDQASLGGVLVPDPGELLEDIKTLDEWRESVEKRSKDVSEKRKSKHSQ